MNEFNEIRFVTRQETFNDLAVRELAQSRAKCICLIQNKRCKKGECASCPTFKRYFNCFSQLSDYDQQRLHNYTAEYYSFFSASPSNFMKHKDYCRYYGKMVAIIIGCLAVFCLMFSVPAPCDTKLREVSSQDEISEVYLGLIQETFEKVEKSHLFRTDISGDGLINCIDRAILFKLMWDDNVCTQILDDTNITCEDKMKRSYLFCQTCELVRNFNPGQLNHLFVMIYEPNIHKYIALEPDTNWKDDFIMTSVWGERYNTNKNFYNETEKYMSQLSPKLRRIYRTVNQ